MAKNSEINWGQVYSAFYGDMEDCLGKDCSSPCCRIKTVPTWGKGKKRYMTSLEVEELDFQLSEFGDLPEGVTTETVDVGIDRVMNIRCLVSGCLAEDGSCKMKNRKPINCRIFPFSPSTVMPLQTSRCPQSEKISQNPNTRKGIIAVRSALGFTDSEEWRAELDKALKAK